MDREIYDVKQVRAIIDLALTEDIGGGDLTSNLIIPEEAEATLYFTAREEMVVCGVDVVRMVFAAIDEKVACQPLCKDGERVRKNTKLIKVSGSARSLLTAERVALNFMQRMSGVATLTSQYVEAVRGTNAKILDTRKTIPGMRALDKYAARVGGAENHRFGLYDMILIKDNHIAIAGGLSRTVLAAATEREEGIKIEVEVDNLEQFKEVIKTEADVILLDNFSTSDLKEAVKLNAGKKKLEASGSVNLTNIKDVAETGVDFVSVGRLTHSAPAIDIGLDYVLGSAEYSA